METKANMTAPTIPDLDKLPPEYALNPYAPVNDRYMQEIDHIKRQIVAVSMGMKGKTVDIVKCLHSTGKNYKDVAAAMGCSATYVSKTALSSEGQELMALLRYLQLSLDGPNEQLRKAMLWRVAVRGETLEPRLTIAAIAEMNKMDGIYDNKGQSGGFTVVIQNGVLARGPLDV